jgi:anaerobic dimethyl sulfoxide reductase subunit C (anchor subunit)
LQLLQGANQKRLLLIVLMLMFLALAVSFLHLGTPRNAIYSLCNFRTSWLSREIFFMSGFCAIVLFEFVVFRRSPSTGFFYNLVSGFGVAASVFLVYSMVQLYRLPTVEIWDTPYTLFHFFNTSLVCGIILFWMFIPNQLQNPAISLAAAVFVLIQLVLLVALSPAEGSLKWVAFAVYQIVFLLMLLLSFKILGNSVPLKSAVMLLFVSGVLAERTLFYMVYRSMI